MEVGSSMATIMVPDSENGEVWDKGEFCPLTITPQVVCEEDRRIYERFLKVYFTITFFIYLGISMYIQF